MSGANMERNTPRFRLAFPGGLRQMMSGKVEESVQLRLLGLATFWLVALSVAWVGGSPWTWLGGGIAATVGHAFNWHRRHRSPGIWPVAMALVIVALAVLMRNEILAAFDGNWLPPAHLLLLIQAVASFDMRTRAGLYAGLGLSGIVLFFASQQALELSFGIFLLAYAALLMAFLATAFLEDETGAARGRRGGRRSPLFGFWSATVVGVLVVCIAAFLLLPRGESNAVGYQQVSALRISGETGGPQPDPVSVDRGAGSGSKPTASEASAGSELFERLAEPGPILEQVPLAGEDSGPGAGPAQEPLAVDDTGAGALPSRGGDDVVMRVRSPVTSYWRGQVFDGFDGPTWREETAPGAQSLAARRVPTGSVEYTQTFFLNDAEPGTTFMGYKGVEVQLPGETRYRQSLGEGHSYKVLSVQPQLDPARLRRDTPNLAAGRYRTLPESLRWLPEVADEITDGARTSYDKASKIVNYLRHNARYDDSAPDQLRSSAGLEDFISGEAPGTSMDFGTATVLLARASGLPARLATGYLPGERDLLSGAYTVRRDAAHAWAEVLFNQNGWVPFDGTHHPEAYAGGRASAGQVPGLKHLFESSVGGRPHTSGGLGPVQAGRERQGRLRQPVDQRPGGHRGWRGSGGPRLVGLPDGVRSQTRSPNMALRPVAW